MSITTKTALFFASLFVIVKLLLFNTGKHEEFYFAVVFSNILFVLLAMVVSIILVKKSDPKKRSFIDDVKTTMRAASLYAIVVSAFVYMYYNKIDTGFIESKIEQRVEMAEQADFAQLQKDNPEKLGNKTREDFIDEERENAQLWFSPFIVCTLTLLGLMLISFLYSFIIAWFAGKLYKAG